MRNRETSPLKVRKIWWSESGFVVVIGTYVGVGGITVYWISRMVSIAAIILGIFLTIMLPVLIFLYKRTLEEPLVYVDEKVIGKTKRELDEHRAKARKDFLQAEISILERGESTPVLDVWRLDASLEKRHPYFSAIDSILINPAIRELWIRIQLGEFDQAVEQREKNAKFLLGQTAEFIRIIAGDSYVRLLKKFFDKAVVELYSLREDERKVDVPFPIFSLSMGTTVFPRIASLPRFSAENIGTVGEMRFNNGNEIVPHRSIGLTAARGGK